MAGKKSTLSKVPLKDTDLPVNNLSPDRIEEIEKKAVPRMMEALEKLKKENPDAFE